MATQQVGRIFAITKEDDFPNERKAWVIKALETCYPMLAGYPVGRFDWVANAYGTFGDVGVQEYRHHFKNTLVVYVGKNFLPAEARVIAEAGGFAMYAQVVEFTPTRRTVLLGAENLRYEPHWSLINQDWKAMDEPFALGEWPKLELVAA